jgi:[glutamine synthetase] adenylyltransferase / [glutamine synthetase]-adenylyl-L-tyrosine phosphorylase
MNEIERIQESSQYLATLLRGHENYQDWLLVEKNLRRRYPLTELYDDLRGAASKAPSFSGLLLAFREFKQRHFLRIGGRDLLGWAGLVETTSQLSDLAGVALQVGLDVLSRHPNWWLPEDEVKQWSRAREDSRLVVIGLGKLGGHELNYVSDVDLLLLHALQPGSEGDAEVTIMLLSRFCQWLSRLLADSVEGDRVFQVDHRLRPYGKDGPLVPTCSAAADYYLAYGRAWERQMLLKARPVAGDRSLGLAFLQEVRPFVFRRFLDFQALDELRAMRDRIIAEAGRHRSGWDQFDVKLGVGGIREVEFLVQSLQLIYGGRQPELDEPNTVRCLDRLLELRLLDQQVVNELKTSYIFLRRVEHWVQLDQNRQTQKLPKSQEARLRLALALGFGRDTGMFFDSLEAFCSLVHGHFLALFGPGAGDNWSYRPEDEEADRRVSEDPSLPAEFPSEALTRFRATLSGFSPFLDKTLGEVLGEYAHLNDPEFQEKVLVRLDRYFSQVLRRPGLVRVFRSQEAWVADFCRGLGASELVAVLLAHHPGLVEGIATTSGICSEFAAWEKAGVRLLKRIDDYGEGLEWIRRMKNERLLQLVLADLRGDINHETLERELSSLADFVIQQSYERVLRNLGMDGSLPLAVLALGRLGSREMSYHSDLDLVFVYRPRPREPEDLIPADVIRLVQRFMRMLSTPMHEGPGYAVDARLRPTGNYGPLIVTRSSWLDYYLRQADLWETQALLRVRSVAGSHEQGSWIETKAQDICYQKRNPEEVWSRICHLRRRMQLERSEEKGDQIDIKLGLGGLTDLEFLAQGNALINGYEIPSLRGRSVRSTLRSMCEEVSPMCDSSPEVMAAFETLRSLEHRLRLHSNFASSRMNPPVFEALKKFHLWPPRHDGSAIADWQDLLRLRRRVRGALQRVCPDL